MVRGKEQPTLSQFQSLPIRRLANFMQLRTVDRRIFSLKNCERVGQGSGRVHFLEKRTKKRRRRETLRIADSETAKQNRSQDRKELHYGDVQIEKSCFMARQHLKREKCPECLALKWALELFLFCLLDKMLHTFFVRPLQISTMAMQFIYLPSSSLSSSAFRSLFPFQTSPLNFLPGISSEDAIKNLSSSSVQGDSHFFPPLNCLK